MVVVGDVTRGPKRQRRVGLTIALVALTALVLGH